MHHHSLRATSYTGMPFFVKFFVTCHSPILLCHCKMVRNLLDDADEQEDLLYIYLLLWAPPPVTKESTTHVATHQTSKGITTNKINVFINSAFSLRLCTESKTSIVAFRMRRQLYTRYARACRIVRLIDEILELSEITFVIVCSTLVRPPSMCLMLRICARLLHSRSRICTWRMRAWSWSALLTA